MMAIAATLCACNKEQTPGLDKSGETVSQASGSSIVFTATMEGAASSKATYDDTARCAAWETGDAITVNGSTGHALTSGASTMFSIVKSEEIRPSYISDGNTGCYGNNPASNLVDDGGTSTRWCVGTDQKAALNTHWNIAVSTGRPTVLKSIKLWNADNTAEFPNRIWQDIQVLGKLSSVTSEWTLIKSLAFINLAANNSGLAGEIAVNATVAYDEYRINIFNNKGDNYMQMADMKFVVSYPEIESPYTAYFPDELYSGGQTVLPKVITETWADGKFNMPMYARSNTTDLQFKNLCGVLKITVKNDVMAAVKSIRISSTNKAVSGKFHVDSNNAAVLDDPSAKGRSVTIQYTQAVTTSPEGTDFYVAIPPQTYQNLKIEIGDGVSDFRELVTKAGAQIVIERNKIYHITPASLTQPATTGTAKARIGGKDVDVNWVQLWAGGPKFATVNVGVGNVQNPKEFGGIYKWGGHSSDDYYTGTGSLTGSNDTATYLWGENWRMPTREEYLEIFNKCDFERYSLDGNLDYFSVSGRGDYSGNIIWFPSITTMMDFMYWTSSSDANQAWMFYCRRFYSTLAQREVESRSITSGARVRAVLNE